MLKDPVDKTQQSWLELMIIMQNCNDRLFLSKDQTTKLVQSEAYIAQLHHLQPLLRSWLKRFNALNSKSSFLDTVDLTERCKSRCTPESYFRSSIITSVSSYTPARIQIP